MATIETWRKAYGALKDSTKVGLAHVNSNYAELDMAIVKVTNHVVCPPKERHFRIRPRKHAFSNDGLLLASGSLDGVIKVWEMPLGNLKCTLDGPAGGIEWLRWHPRGHLLLAGSEASTLWMWNANKGAYLNMFQDMLVV
uniref:Uncharacterized protein n=1 Tax=Kalanchoe fedtschenkoi TaxID=63787 RepID=A0A7N0UCP1_KALFE